MSERENYNPKEIESKWQKEWEKNKLYATPIDATRENKMYILPQLPYPSGSGLHVGHAEVYTACDIYARYQRMNDKKVLQVIGWDAFGLPAENYAIKTNVHPRKSTNDAIDNFRKQIKALGISVDWEREVGSHNADYYKWTQWFFLLMYKRGLAYRKNQSVNWCDSCKTVLANEQVADGKCERCDTAVNQRQMEQWYLKITDYADKLLEGLGRIDWPEETKKRQRDWIGRSEGVNYKMRVKDTDVEFEVYDSVPQTFMAQTFAVIAPEHAKLPELMKGRKEEKEVMQFVAGIKKKKLEGNKFEVEQEIEGIFTGLYMEDPYGTGDLPLWVASFAIADYGSGVVSCSVHDERDFVFAKKYNIPLRPVMLPEDTVEAEKVQNLEYCYHHDPEAILQTPEQFKGRYWGEAREDIIDYLVEKGIGTRAVQYKLRDWSVSRQRFWGAPIPMLRQNSYEDQEYFSTPKAVFQFHAIESSPQESYHHWVDQELIAKGIPSFTPLLPGGSTATLDVWVQTVEQETKKQGFEQERDVVIVGRSLGAWSALKFAEKNPVRKLILVCPSAPPKYRTAERKKLLIDAYGSEKTLDSVIDFVGGEFGNVDFEKINQNVGEIVVYLSTDDPYIPLEETEEFFESKLTSVRCHRFRNSGHFTADRGYQTFPQLIKEVLAPVYTNLRALRISDLPVILPDDVDFKPTGQSPLTYSEEFNAGVEEKYGSGWKREPDTLDTFMCSSWYYFRYLDPHNTSEFASSEQLKNWMPVDFYLGGAEHVNGHLLYSRFFTKVLYDAGYIDFDEPFLKHRHQGIILGEDNRKMSKRWGNVINPTDVVTEFGADTCRMYEMFMGPLEDTKPWSTNGVKGVRRFLDRVWRLQDKIVEAVAEDKSIEILINKTIKKIGEDFGTLQFNTAVAKLMELSNAFGKLEAVSKKDFETFIILLAPLAPHIAEEMWQNLGHKDSVTTQSWPTYDDTKLIDDTITIVVQVNGKVRANLEVSKDISEDDAKTVALADENVRKWLEGKEPKKVIYVKGKLVSVVV